MIIRTHAYARAGLVGNPSDGYHGKTISIIARNFKAEVVLYQSPELVIEPSDQDISEFACVSELVEDVRRHGYYGGVRLIKAAIRRFAAHCRAHGIDLDSKNFTVRYTSSIPRLVGMAGSSAIVTASLRALMAYYDVEIPKPAQANLVLSVENQELGINAGLQDRVIQVFEGAVYMDFAEKFMAENGHGCYEPIPPKLLPALYVAFDPDRAEGSQRFHGHVRALYDEGNERVHRAMRQFARLAERTQKLILAGRGTEIGPLLDKNFDLRASIYRISDENIAMVKAARAAGASAKFAGSGGAIIGTYPDDQTYRRLQKRLSALGCKVFKPRI